MSGGSGISAGAFGDDDDDPQPLVNARANDRNERCSKRIRAFYAYGSAARIPKQNSESTRFSVVSAVQL
jgi:hypothetical protein